MMTEVVRLGTVTGISWETGIIMMINRILVMAKRENERTDSFKSWRPRKKDAEKKKNRQTKRDMYETEEGCLSLDGVHVATNVRSLHII